MGILNFLTHKVFSTSQDLKVDKDKRSGQKSKNKSTQRKSAPKKKIAKSNKPPVSVPKAHKAKPVAKNITVKPKPDIEKVQPLKALAVPKEQTFLHSFFTPLKENAEQFPGVDKSNKPEEIIIGFDFGTSSSKIIVHLPFSRENPAFAIPFENFADPSLKYLLPTRIFVNPDTGDCALRSSDNKHIELAAIKVGLMNNPNAPIDSVNGIANEIPAKYAATAYIALVLRYIRCWFIYNKKEIYGSNFLEWSFNLGLPAAKDDQDEPRNSFMEAGKAAWIASLYPGPVSIDSVKKAVNEVKKKYSSPDDFMINFSLIPEVIAQAHGYTNSEFRRRGLHLLIDAGATTLDINGFKPLLNNPDKKYNIILADVANFGAIELHKERIQVAKRTCNSKELQSHLDKLASVDTTQIVPKYPRDYILNNLSETDRLALLEALTKADDNFRKHKAFYKYIARMLDLLRGSKNPYLKPWNEVAEMNNALPVILCGGASRMPLYRDLIEVEIKEWLESYIATGFSFRLIQLPKPEKLEADISDDEIDRLSVAWGLSFPEYDVGEYFRPSDVHIDRKTQHKNYDDKYIDSSQM